LEKIHFFDFAEDKKGNSSCSYLTVSRGTLFIMHPCKNTICLQCLVRCRW